MPAADEKFKKFEEFMVKLLQHNTTGEGLLADGLVKTYKELLKMFDRKELIQELKKRSRLGSNLTAKLWVPLVARIDYLSCADRDMQMRTKTRVQSMHARSHTIQPESVTAFSDAMKNIEST